MDKNLCRKNLGGIELSCKVKVMYLSKKKSLGLISHNNGWNLTDLLGLSSIPQPQTFINNGIIDQQLIFNIEDLKSLKRPLPQFYYWSAPKNFLGNRLNSFGSNLHYFVYYVPREFDRGQQTPVADIVIEGNGVKLEYYSRINFFPRENISVTIPLKPTQNWLDGRTRRPIDKAMMMRVLADLSTFLVRARYHQDQLQSSIYGFRMETAYEQHNLQINSNIFPISLGESTRKHVLPVEVCTCPEHFDGNSCERCQLGYRRVNNQLFDGICKKCECQGHSQECDPFNGKCLNCQHNTTGSRCEQCLPGFYGNPSLGGVLGQCRPCACPTVENPRSKQCALSQLVLEGAAAVGQDEYVCTACEAGYDGNKCEICADGYFGDPFASDPQKACRPCECNGNIDNAAIGNCDRTTGECLRCIGHTTGSKCEECLSNHWGSALAHTCRPCRCHSFGSLFPQCSNQTGQCQCREGYTSDRCDRCLPGHGDVGNGCPECQCNITGSLGTVCDEVSGQCVCKRGIYGKRCDLCVPSYYNFGPEGCQFCHCNELGAVAGKECHNITGECQCLPNVVGSKCESCAPGFFNMTAGIGCEPCNCAQMSSEGTICDERTGQCRCKSGVTGLKCDKCEPNYYGIGPTGCKRCRVCPSVGQVCDSVTGACVCPPNTQGEMCERCTSNAWNYHQYRGCQLCQCDGIGADSQICDQRTGQCKCKPGYVGHRCDLCEPGHHSFPECKSCQCSLSGTEPSECRGNTCLCSSKEGQCKCKKHVFGLKCDNCIEGAFSLEAWHPLGCTKCFCFERSTECRQAERLYWRQQYAPDRKVVFESPFEMFERKHNLHVLREWPNDYNSHPTNHTPLYWPMPESFKNDRTGSYNGFLRFRIRNEDHNYKGSFLQPNVHIFRLFPQVVLIGSTRIELEHVPPHSTNIDDGIYKIALLNVQHIFIRATYNDMYRGDSISISEISLDVAEELEGGIFDKKEPALGVEQCFNCASGYTGRSCQEAAHGFFIAYITDYLNRPDPIVLSGIARPCDCHSHSQLCDPKTGECIDCLHNTVGTHCERCKDGYYGDALSGLPDACHRCLCPLEDNSLTSTCIASDSSGRGYYCIDCNPGHVGMFCEFCEAGYYGNPLQPGGRCTPCGCHPHGSLSSVCHNITGQCQCREGVEGRACSICSPRHAFLNGVCASCDQGCYRELMLIEDDMEKQLLPLRELISKARPIPHKRLARIRTSVTILSSLLDSIGGEGLNSLMAKPDLSWSIPLTEGRGLEGIDDPTSRSFRHAHILAEEFRLLQERNNESLIKLGNLENNLIKIRAKVQAENKRAIDIVNQLSQFVHRSGQSTSSSQLQYWLDRANSILNTSRERMAIIEKKYNYAKKNAEEAERLLNEITARKLNTTSYGHLVEKHREYQILIKDFRNTLWDEARTGSLAAKNTSLMAESELINLQKIIEEIEKYIKLIEEEINNGNQNIKLIEEKTVENEETGKEIKEKLILKIKNLREEELQNLEGDYLIINELKETKMPLAEKHALELEKQALKLKGQFADTQANF
uniref:LAMA2 n=1 Tax=Meloidogyne hapla TaxID=6305 RepID=A0A1I8BF69_MELHA